MQWAGCCADTLPPNRRETNSTGITFAAKIARMIRPSCVIQRIHLKWYSPWVEFSVLSGWPAMVTQPDLHEIWGNIRLASYILLTAITTAKRGKSKSSFCNGLSIFRDRTSWRRCSHLLRLCYCTVSVTAPFAVVEPDVPVTVIV